MSRHITLIYILLTLLITAGCSDELSPIPDYTRIGEPVNISVPVCFPTLTAATRAPLDEPSLNEVKSLWLRTYSSVSGAATSEWIKVEDLPTHDTGTAHTVTISTLSGPSYIVGVANVENPGVLKSDISAEQPLSELLAEADTWQEFLDIATVTPSNPVTVRAPVPPITMSGCFTTLPPGSHEPTRIDEWQTKDFQSYFIPASEGVADFSEIGAVHLRRVVSHINFNVIPSTDLEVEVNSYQVMNTPRWTWLYERPSANGMLSTFGDAATTAEEAESYYADIPLYSQQYITLNADGSSSFDFWQGENKQTGKATTYADRALRNSTGHFASLSGDEGWKPADEASYLLLSCTITYRHPINVDENGAVVSSGGESVDRTAEVNYLIHLGAINNDFMDFNCFRNVNYTYNVQVNGVDDIRVDAFADDEIYHPEEGLVVDLSNNTVELDSHYSTFNIRLTEEELRNKNFGFIMVTYDNGRAIELSDANPRNAAGEILDSKGNKIDSRYYNWVELRPTTGEYVLADYKPRYGSQDDGGTFLLSDLDKGWESMTDAMKSPDGWYTVYVNEYTYEPIYTGFNDYADETTLSGTDPTWMHYVNQPPRRFYIIVSRNISPDGGSAYSRSKYGVSQQSIQSYYSQLTPTPGGTAIGVEHINETLGLNMGHQFMGGSSQENGRLNAAEWLEFQTGVSINAVNGPAWNRFLTPNTPLQVPAVTGNRAQGGWDIPGRTIAGGNPLELPAPVKSVRAAYTFNDPQANNDNNVEGINACLNRNRDNNGNGRIDPEELRWYVPAIDQYVYLFLGKNSLVDPMMPYDRIPYLPRVLNNQWSDAPEAVFKDAYYPRYMFMSSNSDENAAWPNVMWCMEGTSTSSFKQVQTWSNQQSRPWNLRCIRNLGTNLNTVNQEMKVTLPYTHDAATRTIRMNYFDLASLRVNPYTSNGTGAGQMPIHTMASPYNSVYFGLEYAPSDIVIPRNKQPQTDTEANFNNTFGRIADYISSNPCEAEFGAGWRIPNQIELTMIWNVGNILYSTSDAACWLTCTVNFYNRFTGVGSNTMVNDRLFMVLQQSHGSQLTYDNLRWAVPNNNTSINNLFVRCVKDKR